MDEDLPAMLSLQQGNENALSTLMQRHKEAVFQFTWRYLRHEQDALEITQETFVRVFFKASQFRPKASVKTWIFSIAANLCRDHLRKTRKWNLFSLDVPESKDFADTKPPDSISLNATESLESQESTERIQNAITRLPHKLRFPFVFCVLEKHSYAEGAEVLKTSIRSVESRIFRARKILQEAIFNEPD